MRNFTDLSDHGDTKKEAAEKLLKAYISLLDDPEEDIALLYNTDYDLYKLVHYFICGGKPGNWEYNLVFTPMSTSGGIVYQTRFMEFLHFDKITGSGDDYLDPCTSITE